MYCQHNMEESRTKYILLKDRVGENVERNIFLGLSTKTSPTQVLRGELLEALPQAKQPQHSRKIALVGLDRKKLRIVCPTKHLTRLSDEEVNLLMAISSLGERYNISIDQKRLDLGRRIQLGTKVFVSLKVKGISKNLVGVVLYKGEVRSYRGTMFGVELIKNPGQGNTDGVYVSTRYFTCAKESGIFVALDKIKTFSQSTMETILEIDQRAVAYLEDKPVRGTVRYIGEEKDRSGHPCTMVGLELDSRLGSGSGKLGGKQLFVCRRDFAVFLPIDYVIPEKDFDGNPQRHKQFCRRSNSFDSSAEVIVAARESSKTNPDALIEKQRQILMECNSVKTQGHKKRDPTTEKRLPTKSACRRDSAKGLELPRQAERYNIVEQLASELEAEKRKTEQFEMRQRNWLSQQEQLKEQLREKEEHETGLQERSRLTKEHETSLQEQLRQKEQHETSLQERLRQKEEQETSLQERLRQKEEQETNLQKQLRGKEQEVKELEVTLSATQCALNKQRRQEPRDWVISRDEINVTKKHLGTGGWGSVVEGKFRGYKVAVKQIHELILSPHNRRLFEREMSIASRCRHPCLLQFIGATNDDLSPMFVTELMESSLRALLQQRPLPETEIFAISLDVAQALNYLHLNRPSPIIHRDISSANVLLWRQGDHWRGKVSDYGTANFMRQTMTVAPGAAIYCAPEALTSRQSTKVDVYSFGVLLCEMCIREMPDPQRRDQQIALVPSRVLRGLIRRCVHSEPETRPTMEDIIGELEQHRGGRKGGPKTAKPHGEKRKTAQKKR